MNLDPSRMATLLTDAERKLREQRQQIARLKMLCRDLFAEVMCDDETEHDFRARFQQERIET